LPHTQTIQGDITSSALYHTLDASLHGWRADVVLHDGSPNMGQAWLQDAYGQSELVLKALSLACRLLQTGGTFVSKVFRSADYNSLLYVLQKLFKKVTPTKPPASRNTSAEIYIVCTGYLNPNYLDPKLLSAKYIFELIENKNNNNNNAGSKKINVLKMDYKKKTKKSRWI